MSGGLIGDSKLSAAEARPRRAVVIGRLRAGGHLFLEKTTKSFPESAFAPFRKHPTLARGGVSPENERDSQRTLLTGRPQQPAANRLVCCPGQSVRSLAHWGGGVRNREKKRWREETESLPLDGRISFPKSLASVEAGAYVLIHTAAAIFREPPPPSSNPSPLLRKDITHSRSQ